LGDVTVRLNRIGLERGRMWSAVLAAAAIALPMVFWVGVERVVGTAPEELRPGETITLESYPVADAFLQFTPPGDGWRSGVTLARYRVGLSRGSASVTVQVDTGVADLRRLLERRADRLTTGGPGVTAVNIRPYESPAWVGLDGYRADLYGRNVTGSIIVVGNGNGAAATLVAVTPWNRADEVSADVEAFVSSFVLGGS
jgi:hypothetical protein